MIAELRGDLAGETALELLGERGRLGGGLVERAAAEAIPRAAVAEAAAATSSRSEATETVGVGDGAAGLLLALFLRLDAGDLGLDGLDLRLGRRELGARRLGVGLGLGDLRLLGALEAFELGAVVHLHLPDGGVGGDGELGVDAGQLTLRRAVGALGRPTLAFRLVLAALFELGAEGDLVGVAGGDRDNGRGGGRLLCERGRGEGGEEQDDEDGTHGNSLRVP